ncbi:hypothetical protein RAD16_09665 [Bradyrhizobium sp. 18BD]
MRRIAIGFVATLLSLLPTTALAQAVNCGEQPQFPPDIEKSIKGDVQGKAQLFTKLLGNAELKGAVDTSKKELQQKYNNVDKAKIDQYMAWVSCQSIMQDRNLATEKKNSLWLELYREIMSNRQPDGGASGIQKGSALPPSEPLFAVTFKGDDIWVVNNGAPEENLVINYVALAWLWIHGPPRGNGCNPDDPVSLAEALAVELSGRSSDGLIRTSNQVNGIRSAATLLPNSQVLAKAGFHFCNYSLRYSIALSYDDREGRPQRRFYEVSWTALRGPERRTCRKINKDDFDQAAAAYDAAAKAGSQWNFNGSDAKTVDALATVVATQRGTLARGDGRISEKLSKVLFPDGRPPSRTCEG